MDADYAQNYRSLYCRHWWWRARERLILSTIEEIRRNRRDGGILDIGCGDGLLFEQLSRFGEVEGIETDASLVCENSPWRSKICIAPFDRTFRPGKQYSLILMLDVLEHLSDAKSSLVRALELLDSDGTLIITVPAFPCLWTAHDDLNRHFKRYTKKSLALLAHQAGLQMSSCKYFFHWTFPIKLLLHFKENLFGSGIEIPKVPSRWINETLFHISVVEQKLFGNTPIPFGSSLLAVGGKQ